jgi:hypothetical protein
MASAGSFFEPVAPAHSVHLGMSFSAAHWLSEQPVVAVPEGFYFCEATGSGRQALAAQAGADWVRFLSARAAELAPGGQLVLQMVGSQVDPASGERRVTARALMLAMAETARTMADEGSLDPAAVDRYVLAVYARSPEEAMAPLVGDPAGLGRAFSVLACRTDLVANPYVERWREDGDAAAYAESYGAFVRGFTESSLRRHLFVPGTPPGSADATLDAYFDRLVARFAADPLRDAFEDWTLTVVLEAAG